MSRKVTREAALAKAREVLSPAAVPHPHPELDRDEVAGGYGFMDGNQFAIIGRHGGYVVSMLGLADRTVDNIVAEWLEEERHRHRPMDEQTFGPSQTVALEAVRRGVSVASLAADAPVDVIDHAEFVAIHLRRQPETDPLEVLAATDYLLDPPEAGKQYTHLCPICGTPTIHAERYPRSVGPECVDRATDSGGRSITAFNEGIGGGFIVYFTDSPSGAQSEICDEVTMSGRCWIDGRECSIGEARFGGIVVQTLSA